MVGSAATIPELFAERARSEPDRVAFLAADRTWTYGEVAVTAERVACSLASMGIAPGDRVAIASPNSVEWIVALIATTRLGGTLVALNALYREQELTFMLNESGARVFLCVNEFRGFDFAGFLEDFRGWAPELEKVVFFGASGFDGSATWDELAASEARPDLPVVAAADTTAVMLYTSGTTGRPKGAMLSHRGILASARAQVAHMGHTVEDIFIGHMPVNHVGGLTCTVISAVIAGAATVVVPGYHPDAALAAIEQHGVTVLLGVPTMYQLLLSHDGFAAAHRDAVRICIIGGSNVEPELGRRIAEAFPRARLANLYGLSETSGGCIISAEGDDLEKLTTTLGVAIGDFQVRAVDDSGAAVGTGVEGELQVAGDCLASGYWQRPEDSAAAFQSDGWMNTGDVVSIDDTGHVTIRGRRKEMYVRGGYNVYPAEIENVLSMHPDVEMTAVVGIPDEVYGEVGAAFIVSRDRVPDVEELRSLCRAQLARYKVPAYFQFVEEFPMTTTGKIEKRRLRDWALEG